MGSRSTTCTQVGSQNPGSQRRLLVYKLAVTGDFRTEILRVYELYSIRCFFSRGEIFQDAGNPLENSRRRILVCELSLPEMAVTSGLLAADQRVDRVAALELLLHALDLPPEPLRPLEVGLAILEGLRPFVMAKIQVSGDLTQG